MPSSRTSHRLLWLGALAALSLGGCVEAAKPATPARIDIDQFELSFSEDFDTLDVSEWSCATRWITHTPWAGDFGAARFSAPLDGFPFTLADGVLRIEVKRGDDGNWRSGMLSGWDACDSGFAQRRGYFEIRTRLPEGAGFWPAFWLIGVDTSAGTAEIDVFEHYGHEPDRFTLSVHKHPQVEGETRRTYGSHHAVRPGLLTQQFNTYGVEITGEDIVFFFNREEIWRTALEEEFDQPMYMLVSLAADAGFMNQTTPDSAFMEVDYIRSYKRKPIGL